MHDYCPLPAASPLREPPPSIDRRALRAGDVLLSLGVGNTSNAIRTLDGGQYSHAAVWSGSNVIESTTPAVVEHELDHSLSRHPREYVDVYRFRRASESLAGIADAARKYLGLPYPYGDLALAAILVCTSKWVPTERGQITFLLQGCRLADILSSSLDGGRWVTCVALAVRSYQGAGIPLRIRITPGGRVDLRLLAAGVLEVARDSKRGVEGDDELSAEWQRLKFALARKLAELGEPEPEAWLLRGDEAVRSVKEIFTPGLDWATNLVTPRNLEESPDLELVGRLYP